MENYSFHKDEKTHEEAMNHCIEQGGYLASILNQEENDAVRKEVEGDYWIGLRDNVSEGTFNWDDGEFFSYSNWAEGEPNNIEGDEFEGDEDCVSVLSDGTWNDAPCELPLSYVCKYGVKSSEDGQYSIHAFAKTKIDAQKDCQSNGAELVSIGDQEELDKIWGLMGGSKKNYWIGLSDGGVEGQFTNPDGSMFATWNEGEPNNHGGNEDCVAIGAGSKWNDCPCDLTNFYICENASRGTTGGGNPNYSVNFGEKTYVEAESACREGGGELVSIGSE